MHTVFAQKISQKKCLNLAGLWHLIMTSVELDPNSAFIKLILSSFCPALRTGSGSLVPSLPRPTGSGNRPVSYFYFLGGAEPGNVAKLLQQYNMHVE